MIPPAPNRPIHHLDTCLHWSYSSRMSSLLFSKNLLATQLFRLHFVHGWLKSCRSPSEVAIKITSSAYRRLMIVALSLAIWRTELRRSENVALLSEILWLMGLIFVGSLWPSMLNIPKFASGTAGKYLLRYVSCHVVFVEWTTWRQNSKLKNND